MISDVYKQLWLVSVHMDGTFIISRTFSETEEGISEEIRTFDRPRKEDKGLLDAPVSP